MLISQILKNHLRFAVLALAVVVIGFGRIPRSYGQWKYDITLTGYPKARWKATTSYIDKPAMADVTGDGIPEIIAVSVFGDVFCVDGATGQILWAYEDEHSFDLAIYICPAIIDVNCDNIPDIISITPQGNVICLDGRSGRKIWSYKAEAPIVSSPSAFDLDRNGTAEIAVSDIQGNLYLLNSGGELVWKVTNPIPFYGTPALGVIEGQSIVILSDKSGAVQAFDGGSGKILWRFAPAAVPISTSPLVFRENADAKTSWKVLVGTEAGELYLVNAKTGTQIWYKKVRPREVIGDFALGDINGDGQMDFVFSTSGSRIVAVSGTDGRKIWNRKFKAPVKEYLSIQNRRKVAKEVLTGEPVLVDLDGDGRLDVVADVRGLNNYIYGLRGADGKSIWAYGNKDLLLHPALHESTTLGCCMGVAPGGSFARTVPAFSQPTPIVGDFDGDGKTDLIVNDRDEVGLISVPILSNASAGTWAKYAANSCNNIVNFSLSCLGTPSPPSLALTVDPTELYAGERAKLCWNGNSTTDLEIDQGVGRVAAHDCIEVRPMESTTWQAVGRGCGGAARQQVSLHVKVRPSPPAEPAVAPVDLGPWTLDDVFFEYDWYRLTPDARKTLDENVVKLKAHPQARLALEATCDERGSKIYNKYLAMARAESVREYLLEHGIDDQRMESRPEGETLKWDSNRNDEGWAKNRRVHFVILH